MSCRSARVTPCPVLSVSCVLVSVVLRFSHVLQISSCHAILSTQLADAMMFPITQFKERDLKGETAPAAAGACFLSRTAKVRLEVMEDVYTARKKQHQTTLHYFSALNTLQYKKKISLLEPLLGYIEAQSSFFKLGSENLTAHWEEFLSNIGTSVQNVRREMDSDVESMQQSIEDLKGACDPLYLPDPDPARIPINRNLSRKSGYLNCRK
ncbi:UNVERIFIED_CONTAM: hypothetical protein FKN15_072149 [Acipenser sinensis]